MKIQMINSVTGETIATYENVKNISVFNSAIHIDYLVLGSTCNIRYALSDGFWFLIA